MISAEFPFESKFIDVHGSKMHYVDEGSGDPILFLHGNPTSSYLWRNIIPHLVDKGRCIAPDLIGMGKSDKPDIAYRFFDHAKYIDGFIEALDLKNITLVLHDWGSGLGFHYAMRHEDNIKALAFMESILVTADWDDVPPGMRRLFRTMRTPGVGWFLISVMNMFVKQGIPKMMIRPLTDEEFQHYAAPYPSIKSRKPLRQWPLEVAFSGKPADVTAAINAYSEKLKASDLPKLLLYAEPGAITPAAVVAWAEKNLTNLKTVSIGKGLHYVQEDQPQRIGEELATWYVAL